MRKNIKNLISGIFIGTLLVSGFPVYASAQSNIDIEHTAIAKVSGNLYIVNGTGKYSKYKRLKGYPEEKKFAIYFQGTSERYSIKTEDLRGINLKKVVTWKYKGVTHKNTVGQLYSLFADTSQFRSMGVNTTFSEEWFVKTFGNTYKAWAEGFGFSNDADKLVEQYFKQTGQTKSSNATVTLKPDSKIVYVEEPKKEPSPEEIKDQINKTLADQKADEKAEAKKEFDKIWIGEDELQKDYSILGTRYMGSSIVFFKDNADKKVKIYEITDVPSDLSDEVVRTGNAIKYQYLKSGGLYFDREDLKKAGIIN